MSVQVRGDLPQLFCPLPLDWPVSRLDAEIQRIFHTRITQYDRIAQTGHVYFSVADFPKVYHRFGDSLGCRIGDMPSIFLEHVLHPKPFKSHEMLGPVVLATITVSPAQFRPSPETPVCVGLLNLMRKMLMSSLFCSIQRIVFVGSEPARHHITQFLLQMPDNEQAKL